MTDSIKNLIGELKSYADGAIKQANAMEGIDSLPGSEHDKPAPASAEKADPAVKDDTIDNEEHRSVAGAKNDGDIPASNVNKMEADEAVLNADEKPLDTANANAKEAASKGNSIVDFILSSKQKQAAAKQAAPAAAKQAQPAATKQAAPENTITLDMALMAKIAAITLADEEGQFAVQQALTKRAGAEFANEVLDVLEKRAAEEQAAWEFEKGAQDAEAMIGDMQEAQGAADAEAAMGDLAEAQGAADADAALAGAAGDEGAAEADAAAALEDYSAEEIVQAVQELAQEGQIPPEQAEAVVQAVTEGAQEEGAADDITEEDLADAIVEAVESGELSEEDAQALVQAISEGDAGDAEADQALAQDVAGAADAAPEAAAAADAEKAAAVKRAAVKRAAFKQQLVDVLKGKK